MWPQSNLEEVQEAQELADAGDPGYTWQVDPQLFSDPWTYMVVGQSEIELVDRFLHEVLGWEAYILNGFEGMVPDEFSDARYLRCAPGRTNPLYPPGPEPAWGESCAPTIDDLRYESVSIDLSQPGLKGATGIWVVSDWRMITPFAQADPAVVEAETTAFLDEFLTARIAGQGAEGRVPTVRDPSIEFDVGVPLLYSTTSGGSYGRFEVERVDGPEWPYGAMTFSVRLFADDDATVVEQQISRERDGGLWLDPMSTTENGEPIILSHASLDGEVTASVPSTWDAYWPGEFPDGPASGVWFGLLGPGQFYSRDHIGLVDPVAYDAWCAANGGSPLLTAPADAAAIAQQVIADPNFDTTEPVEARIGGLDAISIDIALAPGGEACGIGITDISRWIHTLQTQPGSRLRLYLVDLPEGMSVETLAITVVASEELFDEFIEETAPIIESIEFHPPD
jgi:hypothetical protein